MLFGNVLKTIDGDYYLCTLSDGNVQYIKLNYVHDNDVLWIASEMVEYDLELKANYKIEKIYEDFTCKKVIWERPAQPDATLEALKALGFRYIARDQDNDLYAYTKEPDRMDNYWSHSDGSLVELPQDKFPNVTWDTGIYDIYGK